MSVEKETTAPIVCMICKRNDRILSSIPSQKHNWWCAPCARCSQWIVNCFTDEAKMKLEFQLTDEQLSLIKTVTIEIQAYYRRLLD